LNETLHTADTAGIDLKEVLLVGVVGYIFVGVEFGPYVSPEFVRRHGVKVEQSAIVEATHA
jgi:hypothetical protein